MKAPDGAFCEGISDALARRTAFGNGAAPYLFIRLKTKQRTPKYPLQSDLIVASYHSRISEIFIIDIAR